MLVENHRLILIDRHFPQALLGGYRESMVPDFSLFTLIVVDHVGPDSHSTAVCCMQYAVCVLAPANCNALDADPIFGA